MSVCEPSVGERIDLFVYRLILARRSGAMAQSSSSEQSWFVRHVPKASNMPTAEQRRDEKERRESFVSVISMLERRPELKKPTELALATGKIDMEAATLAPGNFPHGTNTSAKVPAWAKAQ